VRRFNGDECIAWSPDGKYLVARNRDSPSDLVVWDFDSGDVVRVIEGGYGDVISVAWSPDGRYLAFGRDDNVASVLRTSDWAEVSVIRLSSISVLAWSPDGKYLAGTPYGEYVCVWSSGDWVERRSWGFEGFRIYSLALSPDSRLIATSLKNLDGEGSVLVVRDTSDGSEVYKYDEDYEIYGVAWGPDGRHLVYVDNNYIVAFDVFSGKVLLEECHEAAGLRDVAWSPDGRFIASTDTIGSLYVWDVSAGRLSLSLDFKSIWMGYAPFSPDGRRIVLSFDGRVSVLDVFSGGRVLDFERSSGGARFVSWSPCGRFIAGLRGRVVHVWDASSGDLLTTFSVPRRDRVIGLVWLSDSRHVVTASMEGFVRVWDLDSGSEVAVFRVRHVVPDAFNTLSVSRDDVLAVACESCDVILLFPRDVL